MQDVHVNEILHAYAVSMLHARAACGVNVAFPCYTSTLAGRQGHLFVSGLGQPFY
jgi:hypothetical protein